MLPNNIEAERGVLGSLIIDPEAINQIIDRLRPDDFYHNAHRTIYEALVKLDGHDQPADLITLCDLLEKNRQLDTVGGADYLVGLINAVPTSGNLTYYAQIVCKKAELRRLIRAGTQIVADAFAEREDARELAEQRIFALPRTTTSDFVSLEDVVYDVLNELDARQKQDPGLQGVPTGFRALDAGLGGGLQRSDLIILAARTSQGKTSLGMNIAEYASLHAGLHVAIFSLEMSSKQLAMRLIAKLSQHDQRRLRRGLVDDWDAVVQAADSLAEGKVWVDDTAAISHTELRSKARRLHARERIDLLIVDYLQLMHATSSDGKRFLIREQEIAEISRSLKAVAKELNVPVLALAQLSRAVELRQNKHPQLSDLRESGSLENDADVVLFIFREGLNQETGSVGTDDIATLVIAKNRNGRTGELKLRFDATSTSFHDLTALPGGAEVRQTPRPPVLASPGGASVAFESNR